jgi:hypothetical protein
MEKVLTSFRLPKDQLDWLDTQAVRASMNRTELLTRLIEHFRAQTSGDGTIVPRLLTLPRGRA